MVVNEPGAMNTCGQAGLLVTSVLFGYLASRVGNYDVPFIPMAALLAIGACVWLKVDASERVVTEKA